MRRSGDSDFERQTMWFDVSVHLRESPDLARKAEYATKSLVMRLVDDIVYGVIPFRSKARADSPTWIIKSSLPGEEEDKRIAEILGSNRFDLEEAVRDFFHDCVRDILWYGSLSVEIAYHRTKSYEGRPIAARFFAIPPGTTSSDSDGNFVQKIPSSIKLRKGNSQLHVVSTEDMLTFAAPQRIDRDIQKVIEKLANISDPFLPPPVLISIQRGRKFPFDQRFHSRARHLAIASASRSIGWLATEIFGTNEEVVEHYWRRRELTFEKLKIELRESILTTINNGLRRANQITGVGGQLRFEGFPTLADVEAANMHLDTGDLAFREVFKTFNRMNEL